MTLRVQGRPCQFYTLPLSSPARTRAEALRTAVRRFEDLLPKIRGYGCGVRHLCLDSRTSQESGQGLRHIYACTQRPRCSEGQRQLRVLRPGDSIVLPRAIGKQNALNGEARCHVGQIGCHDPLMFIHELVVLKPDTLLGDTDTRRELFVDRPI